MTSAPPVTVIDKIALYVASLLMFVVAFIVAIMFYEVILRYFFGKPTLWVEELSRWLGGVIFLLAGSYAMQQRSHIRVVWFTTWSLGGCSRFSMSSPRSAS